MADQRISELFEISSSGVASNDVLPIVDTNVSQTKKITAKNLAEAGFRLAADSTLSATKLVATGITSDKIANEAITTAKLAASGVTTAKIASGAIQRNQLAAISVTREKIEDAAVSFAKIQEIATNTLIGRSTAGSGSPESITCTAAGRSVIGAANVTAQRTALGLGNIALATGTWASGATVSGTNTGDQTITLSGDATGTGTSGIAVTISAGAVSTSKIADSGVTTVKIADDAISAAKLADNSAAVVATVAPSEDGAYIGQQYLNSTTNIEYTWTGEQWRQQAGLTSLAVSSDALFTYNTDLSVANTATISGTLSTQAAARFFAGPASGSDAAPTFRAIATSDLPTATNSTLGIARPGGGLTIEANGIIAHSNVTTSGNYYKVTVDENGHVTGGNTVLVTGDIPALDASKITTGTFGTAFISDDAIDGAKIGDRVVCNFGETRPAAGDFVGQFFYDPINKDTYVWDANVWQEISVTAGAIVLAGLYNAGTNQIVALTGAGAAVSGLTVSGTIPAASSGNSGYYFLVSASGTGSGNAPNVTLIPPDLIVSNGSAWYEVDVSSSYVSQNASSIAFTPSGDVGATTVQAAILEVSEECRNASNITSGTLTIARGGTGIVSYVTGDLIVGSGTTLVKLPIGTNNQVLTADSTAGAGMKWATATNGTVTTVSGVSPLSVTNPTTTPTISVAAASTSAAGVVQLSDSTNTTSSTIAATSTAVKSANDLAGAALSRAGGTMTGNLQINSSSNIVLQGTSFNTTLGIINPSAARSISFPDAGGTIITTSGTGIVTTAMVASGAITNALVASGIDTRKIAYWGASNSERTNTAVGSGSLASVVQASLFATLNTAVGSNSLFSSVATTANTAIGCDSLYSVVGQFLPAIGSFNTAVGRSALYSTSSGNTNTAIGYEAGYGHTTGSNCSFIGANASGSTATVSNQITLGNASITSLRCAVQTISSLSDARDKTDIEDLPVGIEFIDKLRPVAFTWQTREGTEAKDGIKDCGFLAQDLLATQSDNNAEFLDLVLQDNPDKLEASYARLMPVVVQALKDVSLELETIKQELAQLKGEA